MNISRRTAFASTAAVAVATLGNRLAAADSASGLKGHINHSVCKWCYPKVTLEDLAKSGVEMGLKSIELLEIKDIPTIQKHGLTCAMVSGVPGGITSGLNRLENHDKIVAWFEEAAPKVAELGCKNIICFSGNRAGMSDEQGLENCTKGIQRLVPILEKHKVTAVMELLNSRVNHADYMCDKSAWGVALCKKAGTESFKLLYDIYHMQIMEGDVIATIRRDHQYFAHYHTGGVPGRHEIDESQELNYAPIMKAIADTGFKGHVAQEFIPARPDVLASLKQGVTICDV
ncbi:MAG TPA: TIM barrel protein [Candidatus Limnocylindria bacterium]|nr:TIM barrel protein [Candidatus Limnocylindria bacterium]